ncbi:hypothetical protein C0993_003104 [Termitomyces sp. T159_Od127]|nr:hypothetical protein C0993_003104 [Termitomyces sp. T159_Od127]
MRLLSLSSYFRCRHSLLRVPTESWATLGNFSSRRHRSGGSSVKPRLDKSKGNRQTAQPEFFRRPDVEINPSHDIPKVDPDNIPAFFEEQVKEWARLQWLPRRLQSFGIPSDEVRHLLTAFVSAVTAGELSTREGHNKYVLSRFVHHLDSDSEYQTHSIDIIYNTILFTWASEPEQAKRLRSVGLSQDTIYRIQALAQAGDFWFPGEEYPEARQINRKVVMHVGPTNSGKTYNALRALAAARTGAYAGPLRLLAHEIWERLNRGQITPAGVEETEKVSTVDSNSALDVAVVHKDGNSKYARACNMRTGEEQRVVDEAAPLMSCTVEMLNLRRLYEVVVIDEIQMIGDPERGNAWTSAVLGVCAKEVHLCGEETAVPIIQALLKDTGDELIINRYERLSPLRVQETLNEDWSKVQKGDCVVTFSRSNIFKLKRQIEKATPFRCAVVYGRLPPEIRSEQAALFNDPNSGYDVLIGSDAVGMGLNLKIRRVIFEKTAKFTGKREEPLSISQTKQIAGRAGRYGLHGNDPPGGYVTSFVPKYLAHIKKALDAPPQPLTSARIGISPKRYQAFSLALPPNSSTKTILAASYYITRIPVYLRQEDMDNKKLDLICQVIGPRIDAMTANDTATFLLSPIPANDSAASEIVSRFFKAYQERMTVDLWECVGDSPLVANLNAVERLQTEAKTKGITSLMIQQLESLHKATVLYVWASFRRPVAWYSLEDVVALKQRLEVALDWALQAITKSQPEDLEYRTTAKKHGKETDGVVYRRWFEERLVQHKEHPQ